MRKLSNPSNWKFFSTLVAVLGLNLAVFLLFCSVAKAQTHTDVNLTFISPNTTTVSGDVLITVEVSQEVDQLEFHINPGNYVFNASHVSGTLTYLYTWNSSTVASGDYIISARAHQDGSMVESTFLITVEHDAGTEIEPLIIEFLESETTINEPNYFTAQTNQAVELTFKLWQDSILLDSQVGTLTGDNTYQYYLDSSIYPSRFYRLSAGAFAADQSYIEIYLNINFDNSSEEPMDGTFSPEFTLEEDSTSGIEPQISLMPTPEFIGQPIEIKAQSNFDPDWVKFTVSGAKPGEYPGLVSANYLYSCTWLINEYPYGEYMLKVEAAYEDNVYQDSVQVNYKEDEVVEISDDTGVDIPLLIKFIGDYPQPMAGEQRIRVETSEGIDSVKFVVSGQAEKEYSGILSSSLEYYFDCLTNDFLDGPYNIRAVGMVDGQVVAENILSLRILNQDLMGDETLDNNQEAETLSLDNTTQESNIKEEEAALTIGVENTEIADEVIEELMPECREAGILDRERCQIFINLDPECQQQGILEPLKCISYLLVDSVCRERGIVGLECERYLRIPLACREANIDSPLECERFIYEQAMPLVCRQAGVSTQSECRQVLLANSFPLVCREANINSAEACRNFLSIKEREFSQEEAATPARVKTTAMLSELHSRCRALGIEDKNKCEFYLNEILITNECRSLGLVSLEECSEYMFKKHSQAVCAEAGISKIGECKDFLFNKYTDNVECQGGNDWLCQEILRQDYLGNIAIWQNVFKQIQEKFKAQARAFSIKELKEEVDDPEFFIPLVNDNVMVSAVDAKERMVLTRAGELLQVAPLVLVIDTDGDGLGDDVEKRIGSKVDNPDTDGDGYTDGMEVAKGYNPLGTGLLDKKRLAPIDIAIISGELLGHPKTEGELSEKYTVDAVNNQLQSGEVASYLFSGRAAPNRVVSLYVYSDLPIVTTVRTDEHGNWQYEFSSLLSEGEHEMYVALNDNTGRIIAKSQPFNFFVKEARAVSVEDFIADAPLSSASSSKRMINFYFIFVGGLIFSGLLLFVGVYIITKKRRSASSKNI